MPEMFTDAQSAFGFVRSETQNIEAEVYRIRYPEFEYASFVPVVTEGNRWASGTTFYTMDTVGKTEWLGNEANDVPYTDLLRDTGSHSFYIRGGAYRWNIVELNRAAMVGISLGPEKAAGTRQVMERFLFDLAVTGNDEKDLLGFINQSAVTAGDVAANGTGSVTWWADKTTAQIAADIAIGFEAIRAATGDVYLPDTLALPSAVYASLITRTFSSADDGTLSILDYLIRNFSAAYNINFQIKALRQLATADPGGGGRAVLYRRTRDVLRFHLPGPFMFLPIHQKTSFEFEQVGLVSTGGVEVRTPKAMLYMDGILNS